MVAGELAVALEGVAEGVLTFANYGISILVIMLVVEIFRLVGRILGSGEAKGFHKFAKKPLSEIGSDVVKGFNKSTGRDKVQKKARKIAARQETKLLDEYLNEQKEVKHINEAILKLKELYEAMQPKKKTDVETKAKLLENLKKAVDKAIKKTNRLKRSTFRQEKKTKQLLQALEKAGIKEKNLQAVKVYENSLLTEHKIVRDSLKKVAGLMSAPGDLKEIAINLKRAKTSQDNAYNHCENLIAAFRMYWKK